MEIRPKVDDRDVLPRLDAQRGELRTSKGEDWVMISGEALRRVYQNEVFLLGTGAYVMWYNAGKAVGKTEGVKFAALVEEMGVHELAKELSESYAYLGWGRIEVGNIDLFKNEVTIKMWNSPMVRGVLDKEPRCWYVRGFMEGLVSTILGVETTASEVRCQAVEGDRCEFRVTWKLPQGPTV